MPVVGNPRKSQIHMTTDNPNPNLNNWFIELAKSVTPVMQEFRASMEEVARRIDKAFAPILPQIALAIEGMQRLPEELRPTIRALAERGWFFSGQMGISELRTLQAWFDSGDFQKIDQYMHDWICSELEAIKARACDAFPNRAAIISSAMDAHMAGQYALSIPVLLIQVEGMCLDTLNVMLYSTQYGVPNTRAATEELIDSPLADVFLLPIREPSGLTASNKTRANFPDAMNRHEILHGHDTGYAILGNSLKSISLMEYFVTLVAHREGKNAQVSSIIT